MTVRKRGNFYWMYFNVNGQRVQQSTGLKNRREAEGFEAAYRTRLIRGEVDLDVEKKPVPKFYDAMQEFLRWFETEAKPNTCRRHHTASKALLAFFGASNKPIDQITVENVEAFKQWRMKQNKQAPHKKLTKNKRAQTTATIKPATCNRELALLRSLFNYFIRNDVLAKANPVSRVKFLTEDNIQERTITYAEERAYLLACSQPLKDVAILMLDCGARPSEIYRLRQQNVSLSARTLQIQDGKTKNARRKIPLTERAMRVLQARIEKAEGDYLFPGMRGETDATTHVVKLNNAHRGAVRRAGVEWFTMYALRHTFATRAAEAGVDLTTLSALLGHSRIQMTMRYAHPSEQNKVLAIEKLEAVRLQKRIG